MDLILRTMFTVMKRKEADAVHMRMQWERGDIILLIMTKGILFIGGTMWWTRIIWQAQ